MFLTNIAIAGALGVSAKVYRDASRKKEKPWTALAVKMNKKPKKSAILARTLSRRPNEERISPSLSESGEAPLAKGKRLISDVVKVFNGSERQEQQQAISTSEELETSELERKINRNLYLSGVIMGLTLYPPLRLVGAAAILYTSTPFFSRAYQDLRTGRITTYVGDAVWLFGALATGHLFLASFVAVLVNGTLKVILKTEDHSRKKLTNVFNQQPRHVWIRHEDDERQIPFEAVNVGDVVVVHAGEVIPVDGTVQTGLAMVDQRMLTGEAQPVEKADGDQIFATTLLLSGRLYITVEQAGNETIAAQIGHILDNTIDYRETLKARGQSIADKWYPMTLAATGLSFLSLGPIAALAVLSVPFAYDMRLFGPFSVLSFLQIFSQRGILIKDGRTLESLQQVDTMVFDKTGTLTLEQPEVRQLYAFNGLDEATLLTYAATAEYRQPHPIAKAILSAAEKEGLSLLSISDGTYEVGYGIQATIGADVIKVGSARFLTQEGIVLPEETKRIANNAQEQGFSLVYVAINQQFSGIIELQPRIRPEAKEVIRQLRAKNIELYIISGDHEQPTRRLAQELGIDNYFAETLPENKADLVKQLRDQGKFVCFVGDGINDSIALKTANVSISLRGASSAAIDNAQIILMDGTLNKLNDLFEIALDFEQQMQTNFAFSVVPSLICIGGVFFLHFGLWAGMAVYNISRFIGLANTMSPLMKYENKTSDPLVLNDDRLGWAEPTKA